MKKTIEVREMLQYLADDWAMTHRNYEQYGNDPRMHTRTSWCIGMKEMAEALIGVPVNLKRDGTLTIGLDGEETLIVANECI